MARILIADDHKIIRNGIKAMPEDVDGFTVAGKSEFGQEAINQCEQGKIDFVNMNINMPETDGIEATGPDPETVFRRTDNGLFDDGRGADDTRPDTGRGRRIRVQKHGAG